MSRKIKITSIVAAATLAIALSSAAPAENAAWMRVIVVKTDKVAEYLKEIEHVRALYKRLGINVQNRVWRATYAGPDAGTLIVTAEFPSWAALSEWQTKSAADAEFRAWAANLAKVRTVVSDSLYREL
jgi:hypothetical protein